MVDCPTPTTSITNFKIINGVASCDIVFDATPGGNVANSSVQLYNGVEWDTSLESLYYKFQEGSSGILHLEWQMMQMGDCVVAVKIANTCGNNSEWARQDLVWAGEDIIYDAIIANCVFPTDNVIEGNDANIHVSINRGSISENYKLVISGDISFESVVFIVETGVDQMGITLTTPTLNSIGVNNLTITLVKV